MVDAQQLITDNIDVWTSAIKKRNATGRGSSKKIELSGIKKLRELILELAVRGKLVPQDASDEPASVLLERIAEEKAQLIADKKIKKTKVLPEITDEEELFELPYGWEKTRFGNVYVLEYGDNLPKPKRSNSGEYNVYGSNGVVGSHNHPSVQKPCIVIGRKGSAGALNLCNENGCWVTDVAYSVVPPSVINLNFAFLQFHTFGLDTLGKGIKPGLNRNEANLVVVTIPPLAEQHRIVAKVDELMALCDQLEQQTEQSLSAQQTLVEVLLGSLLLSPSKSAEGSATESKGVNDFQASWQRIVEHFDVLFTTEHSIEQLKQTILQLAVMGKLVPQNSNDESASVLLEKIAKEKAQLIADKKIKKQKQLPEITDEEKPFGLPRNWDWVRLGDVYRFLNGFAFKSEWFQEQGTKLLRNINIAHGETKWLETACIPKTMADEYSRFELEAGDIVISLDRPIINTGLKYAVIQTTDLPCLLLQRVAKFHSLADIVTPAFLSRWLESDLFMNSIDPGRSNGVPHISTKQLEMMPFPLCSSNEQQRIVAKVDELMALCKQLKARLTDSQTTQLHLVDAVVENAIN
ncbi:restriction endonuclease subunit S [Pseudoalteromonas sp. NBT06-2]|uniref:restriction endonuclease subunit S n=1 Tax=Pseudoalteromonas sp. NBT06-2 TaxID=2025950 RepID=UPI000BA649FA|nr:restriction endonuclease subunit S [Pseudoalteromonas sp. NBT06-2]PAJ74517.1 restriction endonuclease subunit S [Pseudoalteromonas sp. NBT06-2]